MTRTVTANDTTCLQSHVLQCTVCPLQQWWYS